MPRGEMEEAEFILEWEKLLTDDMVEPLWRDGEGEEEAEGGDNNPNKASRCLHAVHVSRFLGRGTREFIEVKGVKGWGVDKKSLLTVLVLLNEDAPPLLTDRWTKTGDGDTGGV